MTPKIKDYNKWSYIRKIRPGKWGVFALIFFVVAMLLVIVLADLLSGLISGRGSIMNTGEFNLSSYSLYAIDVGSFSSQTEANTLADNINSQGGAGYVYHNGDYYVFVAMYKTFSEAQEVKQNLEKDGLSCRIYTINMPSINIKLGSEERDMEEAIRVLKNLYNELYDISISYDKGITSRLAVISEFTEIKKKVDSNAQKVYDIVLSKNTSQSVLVHTALNKASLSLSRVIASDEEGKLFNGLIKYTYFDIAFIYLELSKGI